MKTIIKAKNKRKPWSDEYELTASDRKRNLIRVLRILRLTAKPKTLEEIFNDIMKKKYESTTIRK